jgi:hypothetical protein
VSAVFDVVICDGFVGNVVFEVYEAWPDDRSSSSEHPGIDAEHVRSALRVSTDQLGAPLCSV